ncbi:FadR/GntR family transcriptional regulator [Streptomyces sp. DSM 44917]|uniref:FadR/GntR family transcriptional regulator n=1 Tax=Streptomyces boetiae TaxID=3075541 RepID=A0ABU2L4H8_9ACTN|nr:FadR/GntR family transcriptional regulator [Streptomyces sp. DSM 44917]MDT0306466.1 FadR/GntR family transcriptional regulator [Streptomyces sp. DSM 44917]
MTAQNARPDARFTAVRLGRVSRQVVEQFQRQLREGNLRPGDRLPPEREMAAQFGVGRNSVREALRELDLLGLVESRHGEGTFVSAPSPEALMTPFRAVIELSSTAAGTVMEFRRAFEPGVAALAATNLTDAGRDRLHAALTDFETRVTQGVTEVERADADFHLMTGHATENAAVIGVHTALYTLLRDVRSRVTSARYGPSDSAVAGHRLIYEAILARDPEAAAREMRAHLDDVSETLADFC